MEAQEYMHFALKLAKKGEGKVNPNPLVGAVIVKNGNIIGQGYHHQYGGPHAEVYALQEAGTEAKDATIYVTLEPCSHYGKTPPCAKKIIDSGIKRCIIAMEDPNPLVAGKGIAMMKEAGIQVEVGLCETEARALNRVFLKYISTKTPFLFLKCGITLDGKLATRSFQSKWITNETARERVQYLRNKYMGIMVGIHTVIEYNPSLDARIENGRDPYRIIVDPYLEIPLSSKLLHKKDKKVIIITSLSEKETDKRKELEKLELRFIFLKERIFSFSNMLEEIGKLGVDSVLLEGGGQLISAAFQENVIDGGEIFIAPKILGDEKAVSFISGFCKESMEEAISLPNVKVHQYGNNCSMEFYR